MNRGSRFYRVVLTCSDMKGKQYTGAVVIQANTRKAASRRALSRAVRGQVDGIPDDKGALLDLEVVKITPYKLTRNP